MPFQPGQSGNPDKQFKPGQSGNPAGYPLGKPNRATLYRRWLDKKHTFADPTDPSQQAQVEGTIEDALVLGIICAGIAGDVGAAKEVFDSVYGKITDKQEILLPVKTVIRIGGKRPTSTDAAQPTLPADK